ncbi:hypothetical protein GCM10010211_25530 [Streptomyces albospinus]|uniref:Cell wall-active antibiotics response LiaF-like C-terminal domain-containing protein n=1 Tax=Streptomyces albospinus TaxID=285515 RepID=A0ABQ2UXY7_9ACTN|nr:DUF1707 domain-containing protein [Streptomyces albospinus]GGU59498.1 hypothetical protein GCM10010211_25530 [Streptomyces albospinus]
MTQPQRPDLHKDPAPVPPAPRQSSVLASDAEREDMIERLREATAEGRLTLEELAERYEAAYLARTREELASVGEDLPATAPQPSPDSAGQRVFKAVFGDLTLSSPALEHGIEATAVFGDLTLDLCSSPAPTTGELTISARAVLGDVHLLLPEGVRVELNCSKLFGDLRDLTRAHSGPESVTPLVRITGSAVFGDIVVAHPSSDRRTYWQKWLDERRRGA